MTKGEVLIRTGKEKKKKRTGKDFGGKNKEKEQRGYSGLLWGLEQFLRSCISDW